MDLVEQPAVAVNRGDDEILVESSSDRFDEEHVVNRVEESPASLPIIKPWY